MTRTYCRQTYLDASIGHRAARGEKSEEVGGKRLMETFDGEPVLALTLLFVCPWGMVCPQTLIALDAPARASSE